MQEIINELYKENEKFNSKAVELARKNKGKINQYLLDELKKIIDGLDENNLDIPIFADYAIYLLAEFKDTRVCPLVLDLVSFPSKYTVDAVGYGIFDRLPSILVSVFDGDFERINSIISNKKLDWYVRSRVLASYQYFYENGIITEKEFISYLRDLIKLYEYEYDEIFDEIVLLIADCHLFTMIEDVKMLFARNLIEISHIGDYADFIDNIFNYDNILKENIKPVDKVENYMTHLYGFDTETDIPKNMSQNFSNFMKEDLKEHEINYNKVGRNDPCPCGSGKKFKKCCLNKVQDMLPYQKYINESLAKYPKKNDNAKVDFYSFYNEDYIKIDELLYKGLKRKQIPLYIDRNMDKEFDMDFKYLDEAYPLIKEVISKNNFKTIDDYDEKVSIHFSLYSFFDKYSICLIKKYTKGYYEYLDKLKELIKYFYDVFDINGHGEAVFLERIDEYYTLTKKYEEGINFFENKLVSNICCKYDIYPCLFDLYSNAYDYDKTIKKIDDSILKEDDKEIKEYLEELKLEYVDDETYWDTLD